MVSFLDMIRGAFAIVIGKDVINIDFSNINAQLSNMSVKFPRLYSQVIRFEEWRDQSRYVDYITISDIDSYFHILTNWVDNDNYISISNVDILVCNI